MADIIVTMGFIIDERGIAGQNNSVVIRERETDFPVESILMTPHQAHRIGVLMADAIKMSDSNPKKKGSR